MFAFELLRNSRKNSEKMFPWFCEFMTSHRPNDVNNALDLVHIYSS